MLFSSLLNFFLIYQRVPLIKNEPKIKFIINKPAGYYGFYTLGVTHYIKENYDLSDYKFSGASAGAWNSLFSVYTKNNTYLVDLLVNSVDSLKNPSIYEIQTSLKKTILQHTASTDYDFSKLYVGVTSVRGVKNVSCDIYTNFETLEDAIDCCFASSHIPLITGGIITRYKKIISLDGGFSDYPYIKLREKAFVIEPWMWQEPHIKFIPKMLSRILIGMFPKKEVSACELYHKGWLDAKLNKDILNKEFKLGKF